MSDLHRGTDPAPTSELVPVEGGDLHLLRFGSPEAAPGRTVLAVHGITASGAAWPAVARALPADWSLVAPDLRGRGRSRDVEGPAGLLRHAADVCLVAEALDPERSGGLVLAGHSMGAYVAALAARSRPDLFSHVVLVDGGVPLPVPEGVDPDAVLEATLGPALERLSRTYDSAEDYVAFFRQHPALGPTWDDTIESYVRHDVLETPDGVRSRAVEEAVRADGRDLLTTGRELDDALRGSSLPTHLLVAPLGMFGQAPGLLPADAVAAYDAELAHLQVETIPDVNHYTILFDATAAARIADVLVGGS
jgi:pimeloyl-ACP methyl ester carboxylesterase